MTVLVGWSDDVPEPRTVNVRGLDSCVVVMSIKVLWASLWALLDKREGRGLLVSGARDRRLPHVDLEKS